MAEKPRLLVLERDQPGGPATQRALADGFEVVRARTMARALVLLREQEFAGVYVDAGHLSAVRWAGVLLQADEILDAIADGVAVVDPDLKVIWYNPEFAGLVETGLDPAGGSFYRALGAPEVLGPDPCPFTSAVATRAPSGTNLRIGASRYLRVTVTPVFEPSGEALTHLIALTRDITGEVLQEQKIAAIHKAGEELADLTPEELSEMGVEDRIELLKYNIIRHMRDLLGLDVIEIRLLDRDTGRLRPLLAEGMTDEAAGRELRAEKLGNGVTGFVAATGQSYLCQDTATDPLYLAGAPGARSSLTVPLVFHGTVIGTLNVENPRPGAFDERDRLLLEIYARNIASALNTLELLQAEKHSAATESVEAIRRELALPLDDILSDAITVLDRSEGGDSDVADRLRHLVGRAREIRELIQKVGTTLAPPDDGHRPPRPAPPLAGARVLVADADEAIRRAAHNLLGRLGAVVETARDAQEAVALARQTPYHAALADIRLPDLDGYETFRRLRAARPGLPVILMTGFGYDPTHSIVKARQEGLQNVLYKPFRADRLTEAVCQALRPPPPPTVPPAPRDPGS